MVDEAERPDQPKLDAYPAELNYVRGLKTNANLPQKRLFKTPLKDFKNYLIEKFELKEAEVDPMAQYEGIGKGRGKRGLWGDDGVTDHDKEKKDRGKEEAECDKQRDNGDESQECKDKRKEEGKNGQDKNMMMRATPMMMMMMRGNVGWEGER